jgi:Zn finger protein HypA/HybF involved in hydrogenase expression
MECTYCHKPMIEVVLGWHCPHCHATAGRSPVNQR